jgi:hypothetical protein
MRDAALAALVGLFVALIAAGGEPLALPLHHIAGRLAPAPPVPVVVVRADTELESVLSALSEAGVGDVWAVSHAGLDHPMVRDGTGLVVPQMGEYRLDGRLLPMPEGRAGLTRLDATRLAGVPSGFLSGLDVVLTSGANPPELARASDALAVGLGTRQTGWWLSEATAATAAGACGLLAALITFGMRRRGAPEAFVVGIAGTCAAVAAVVGARALGLHAPAMGLVSVALLPSGMVIARSVMLLGWSRPHAQAPVLAPRRVRRRPWAHARQVSTQPRRP